MAADQCDGCEIPIKEGKGISISNVPNPYLGMPLLDSTGEVLAVKKIQLWPHLILYN